MKSADIEIPVIGIYDMIEAIRQAREDAEREIPSLYHRRLARARARYMERHIDRLTITEPRRTVTLAEMAKDPIRWTIVYYAVRNLSGSDVWPDKMEDVLVKDLYDAERITARRVYLDNTHYINVGRILAAADHYL